VLPEPPLALKNNMNKCTEKGCEGYIKQDWIYTTDYETDDNGLLLSPELPDDKPSAFGEPYCSDCGKEYTRKDIYEQETK
jgi:hypothetical protein